jgi:hypothetical protein
MWVLRQWLVAVLLATTPAYADGISGTYVGKGNYSAFLVQIVETAGGQLTGRYEQTVIGAHGKFDQMIASITGASDGQTVVVTIKPNTNQLFSSNITASGTIRGTLLHLSGGGGDGSKIDLNLTKSDEAAYRTLVASLTGHSDAVKEEQTQADQLAHLNELTKSMLTYSTEADAQLAKFPPIEQRYRTITDLMNAALVRQQSIDGDGQASVARGQIGVAINQAGGEAEQLHVGLQAAGQEIGSKTQPMIKDGLATYSTCQSAEAQQSTDLQTACLKFREASTKFIESLKRLGQAFDQAEKVWLEERHKQESIIKASDVASR